MSSNKNTNEESSSPEKKKIPGYDRILKVTTRKRSLSQDIKEEPSSPSKKQKVDSEHKSSESSESDAEYAHYCEHINCPKSTTSKSELREHSVDFEYHKDHFNKFQLFCNACQDHIKSGLWDDTDGQNMVNSARARKADLKQLIRRLKTLHEKKLKFKDAEAEFLHGSSYLTGYDNEDTPHKRGKYGTKGLTLKLPGGTQEFPLLVKEWQQQNLFGTMLSMDIPTDMQYWIDRSRVETTDVSLQQLHSFLQQIEVKIRDIKNDEMSLQWLTYNACKLKQYLKEKRFNPEATPKHVPAVKNKNRSEIKTDPDPHSNFNPSPAVPITQMLVSSPELVQKGVAEGFKDFLKEAAGNPQLFQFMLGQPQAMPVQQLPLVQPMQPSVHIPVQQLPVQMPFQQPVQLQPMSPHPVQTSYQQPMAVPQVPVQVPLQKPVQQPVQVTLQPVQQPVQPLQAQVPIQNPVVPAPIPDMTNLMAQIIASLTPDALRAMLALKEAQQGTNPSSSISSPPPSAQK